MAESLAGRTLYYTESGQVVKVLVLEDLSDDTWFRCILRVLEMIEQGPYRPMKKGWEFQVFRKRNYGVWPDRWWLRDSPYGNIVAPEEG